MTSDEALRIIDRLKNSCVFHRFAEPGVTVEYTRFFKRYDYSRMNEAVDTVLFEDDSKNTPAISTLFKAYKNIQAVIIENNGWCDVCNDRGFIPVKEIISMSETEKATYEVIYYCPFCNKGNEFNYDGKKVAKKENQSDYKTYPITAIYNDDVIDKIRTENRKTKVRNEAARELQKKHRRQGMNFSIGRDIPNIKF